MIKYLLPLDWFRYDLVAIAPELIDARASLIALRSVPYQRDWVDALQKIQLKREVAGTSRIEGAEFTERELDAAFSENPHALETRSQRQAHAAVKTYRWIAKLPDDRPFDRALLEEIHRSIITGADDDHCPPGDLRKRDQNVSFGAPRHRGAEGGKECEDAVSGFLSAFRAHAHTHEPLVQALVAHYHLAAMHPFLDGNGRTARAVEALLLQRAGLRDTCFIAMSNYYYDEKANYLDALSRVRALEHDLTPFLKFALRGVAVQSRQMLAEIHREVSRAVYRDFMYSLVKRLKSPRRRLLAVRQIEILKRLLEQDEVPVQELFDAPPPDYAKVANPRKALIRDLNDLLALGAIRYRTVGPATQLAVELDWPSRMTEPEFLRKIESLPKSKTYTFLDRPDKRRRLSKTLSE